MRGYIRVRETKKRMKAGGTYTSKFVGVSLDVRNGAFRICLNHQNRCLYLGTFHDEMEAARGYDIAVVFLGQSIKYVNAVELPPERETTVQERIMARLKLYGLCDR
jgi:hypothetical protein